MAQHTFLIYDTPLNGSSGSFPAVTTFTYSSATIPTGTITVTDNDNILHDNSGYLYTLPVANYTHVWDPGADQRVLTNTLNPSANGDYLMSASHFAVTGSDGSQFLAFQLFSGTTHTSPPWGNAHGIVATTAPLQEGVTYSFDSSPPVGFQGSGGAFYHGAVPYALLVCFTSGTMIRQKAGEIAVEELEVGDPVMTLDHGEQPIRWIGSRSLSAVELALFPKLRPIRIAAGALGDGSPERDLIVSPQHRMLIRSAIAERMFGASEILVPALKLLDWAGVERVSGEDGVTYWHFLLDDHQLVTANGAVSESLFVRPQTMEAMPEDGRAEIIALFPELGARGYRPAPARPIVAKRRQVRRLMVRHARNVKPLVDMNLGG